MLNELVGEALAVEQRLREVDTRIRKLLDDHPEVAPDASWRGIAPSPL